MFRRRAFRPDAFLAFQMIIDADPVYVRFPVRMTLRLPIDVTRDRRPGDMDFTGPAGGSEKHGAAAA